MREKQEQLEWEARAGRVAAYAAWFAALLIVATFVWRIVGLPHGADNASEFLPDVHAHEGAFLVSGILTGLAMIAFIPPLVYLYEVTRYRRRELPPVARWLAIFGPILFLVCSIWLQMRQSHAADQFVAGSVKTTKHAEDLIRDATGAAVGVSLAASIAVGLATVFISLNAMRAGLLSRFMGVLGIILGALFVIPLVASPIIQLFWLLALGALFVGQWPGEGRGPAWDAGEAIPWPTSDRYAKAADGDEPGREPAEKPDSEPEAAQPNARASRKRKKRKARR